MVDGSKKQVNRNGGMMEYWNDEKRVQGARFKVQGREFKRLG
jgi:hypothetical protein